MGRMSQNELNFKSFFKRVKPKYLESWKQKIRRTLIMYRYAGLITKLFKRKKF